MTLPDRKPEQVVDHGGLLFPRGNSRRRACDLKECSRPAESLVSAADGSVLWVCYHHEIALVGLAPPASPAPRRAERRRRPVRFRARHAVRVGQAAVGSAITAWGLVVSQSGGDLDGILTGALGCALVVGALRPKRR